LGIAISCGAAPVLRCGAPGIDRCGRRIAYIPLQDDEECEAN
jgi:hypothetical protein